MVGQGITRTSPSGTQGTRSSVFTWACAAPAAKPRAHPAITTAARIVPSPSPLIRPAHSTASVAAEVAPDLVHPRGGPRDGAARTGACGRGAGPLTRDETDQGVRQMGSEGRTDELLVSIDGGIARATFNRPQARNALTFAMYEDLAAFCARVNEDPSVRVLVISGAGGKAFAAGTDIAQFRAFTTPQDPLDYERRIDRILSTLETCQVPTIASVAGACTGGGAAIAACCDLRVASAEARFGFPIARTLGNCLSLSSLARLSGLVGAARVKEMIFTGRLYEAEEAKAAGFLHEVVPDADALAARTEALALTVAAQAPLTLRATKEGLRRIQAVPSEAGDDLILMCYTSEDFREGIEAFLGKRPPQWKGR